MTTTATGAPEAQRRAVLSENFERMMAKRYALKKQQQEGGLNGTAVEEEQDAAKAKKPRVEAEAEA